MNYLAYIVGLLACILLLLCPARAMGQDAPLISYWTLDDQTAQTTAVDESSLSDGSLVGNTSMQQTGVNSAGTSAEFDGNGDYIVIPHVDDFLIDDGTVVFWFNAASVGTRQGLWSKDSTGYDTGGHLTFFQESDGRVSVRLQSTTTSYEIYSTQTVTSGTWHHIAFEFGSDGMELFFDGVSQGTDPYTGGLGTTSGGVGNKEPIVIGGNSYQSNDLSATPIIEYFDGAVDDIGIVSERWSSDAILELYQQTGPSGSINLGSFAVPQVFYVRTTGSDSTTGTSASNAFRTITKAINSCTRPGATVYVGPGSYAESLQIGFGTGANAVSGSSATQMRVIADTLGDYTLDNPGEVVLEGSATREIGIQLQGVDWWSLQGFAIRGYTDYGVHLTDSGATLLDLEIEVPTVYGIYGVVDKDTRIEGCYFDRNTDSGHLAWIMPSTGATDIDFAFVGNDATLRGELYLSRGYHEGQSQSNGSGSNSSNGYSAQYGLILYGYQIPFANVEVSNNQFSDIYLPMLVYCRNSSSPIVVANNTLVGCMFSIYCYIYQGSSPLYVHNNIISKCYYGCMTNVSGGPTLSVSGLLEHRITYNMSSYARPYEFDVLTGDPFFYDPESGDFSLYSASVAVDSGSATYAPSTDINGRSRPADGNEDGVAQVDLGAYEETHEGQPYVRVINWHEIGGDNNR